MANNISYIPDGPKNLAALFPTVDFSNVLEYFIEVLSPGNAVLITTPVNVIGCCCAEDRVRIHFLNYSGTFDAINFNKPEEVLEVKSDSWEKQLKYPLLKSEGGVQRFNVKSNESYTATTTCYREDDMIWVKELLASPIAFIEWKGIQGQLDNYMSVVITDAKFVTRKSDERYTYELSIQFSKSNEKIILRN